MKQLMRVAALWLLTSVIAVAGPIPSTVLYQDPFLSRLRISPTGEFVSAYLIREEASYLSLLLPESDAFNLALKFEKKISRLVDYQWVDKNTLFVRFKVKSENMVGFLTLGTDPEGKLTSTFRKAEMDAYILDPLIDSDDRVVLVKRGTAFSRIFNASIDEIIEGKLTKANRGASELSGAAMYRFDAVRQRLMGLKFDAEAEQASYWFQDDRKRWQLAHKWKLHDYEFEPLAFTEENTLAVLSNKVSETIAVVEFDLVDQEFGEVLYQHPRYDLDGAEFSEDGSLRTVTFFDHGRYTEQALTDEAASLSEKLKRAFAGKQVQVVSQSSRSNRQIIKVFGSDDPGTYYVLDPDAGTARIINDSYRSLADLTLAKTELITVVSQEGTLLEGFLTLPPAEANGVVLVMPHGGPIDVRDIDTFNADVQYLASRGYAVLRVNFRGSYGYGREFRNRGVGGFGTTIESDIQRVVEAVERQYGFKHACTIGASYGGYSAVMLAISDPERFRCAVGMFGIYDLPLLFNESNYKTSDRYRRYVARATGDYNEGMKEVSPTFLADQLEVPVLLIAGEADQVAVYEHTNRFAYLLRALGKDVEVLSYEGVGHGHHQWWGDRHQMAYIDDFLREHLGLDEPPDSAHIQLEDALLLAKSFSSADAVKDDLERASRYYRKAADLGDPEAMYQLARMYRNGEGLARDMEAAIGWLTRASNKKHLEAALELGGIYRGREADHQDLDAALRQYELAAELGDDRRPQVYQAEFYCLGLGVARDLERCLELLELDADSETGKPGSLNIKAASAKQREIIASILLETGADSPVNAQAKNFAIKHYELTETIPSLTEQDSGLYRPLSMDDLVFNDELWDILKSTSDYKLVESGEQLPARADHRLGVRFSIKAPWGHSKNRVAILARYSRLASQGQPPEVKYTTTLSGKPSADWSVMHQVYETGEYAESRWLIELFDLSGNTLYQKTFEFLR